MLTRSVSVLVVSLSLGCWGDPVEERAEHPRAVEPLTVDRATADRTTAPAIEERREAALPTAEDQPETLADREITRRIREAIVGDEAVSVMGANVIIVTRAEHVTLRGDVGTPREREVIAGHAAAIAGPTNVDNRVNVTE